MKKSSLLILIALFVFVASFAGVRPQPSSILAQFEEQVVIPDPQIVPANTWVVVRYQRVDGFGGQFSWLPTFPTEILMTKGVYRAVGIVTLQTQATYCTLRMFYNDGLGNQTLLTDNQLGPSGGSITIPVEQPTFLQNNFAGASVNMDVDCDAQALVSQANLYVINQ